MLPVDIRNRLIKSCILEAVDMAGPDGMRSWELAGNVGATCQALGYTDFSEDEQLLSRLFYELWEAGLIYQDQWAGFHVYRLKISASQKIITILRAKFCRN